MLVIFASMVGVDFGEAVANGQRPADDILRIEPDMGVAGAFVMTVVVMHVTVVVMLFAVVVMLFAVVVMLFAMDVGCAFDVFGSAQEVPMVVKADGIELGILLVTVAHFVIMSVLVFIIMSVLVIFVIVRMLVFIIMSVLVFIIVRVLVFLIVSVLVFIIMSVLVFIIVRVLVFLIVSVLVFVIVRVLVFIIVSVLVMVVMRARGTNINTGGGHPDVDICAGIFYGFQQCFFITDAVDEDEIGFGDSRQVAGRGDEVVRVAARRDERTDIKQITGDIARHIRQDAVRRDHDRFGRLGADIDAEKQRQHGEGDYSFCHLDSSLVIHGIIRHDRRSILPAQALISVYHLLYERKPGQTYPAVANHRLLLLRALLHRRLARGGAAALGGRWRNNSRVDAGGTANSPHHRRWASQPVADSAA